MESNEKTFNEMQTVKRRFFAMRNGVIADTLRRGGSPFSIIFGLNVPQLREIAAEWGHRPDLAARLWANVSTRESLMLATMLWAPNDFTADELTALCRQVPDVETADMVAMYLVSRRDDAQAIAVGLYESERAIERYLALRVMLRLLGAGRADVDTAQRMADAETARAEQLTRSVAAMLADEVAFVQEERE